MTTVTIKTAADGHKPERLWVCLHCRLSLWATGRQRPKCPGCNVRMIEAVVPKATEEPKA